MKKAIVYIVFAITPIFSIGQSMISIFKLLPPECTPEINERQRDTLIKAQEYIIPGGNSEETVKYDIDIDEKNRYLLYTYSFTSGQRGFVNYEVKKFQKTDGGSIIVFSSFSGVPRDYSQRAIRIYELRNNRLIKSSKQELPLYIDINKFLKNSTPKSIRQKLNENATYAYRLNIDSTEGVAYSVQFYDEYEEYFIGDTIFFTWTGTGFKQNKAPVF